ncbi:MAG: 30S ribosomal protein S6 [Deltaproteobacteria bacterium]|nr:30S ribosomal protein S6 [Deltaproteobacteria bacterium]MBZ0220241.1 30S ribosomal protein S6 [Deltaproteobacteria bacterium]
MNRYETVCIVRPDIAEDAIKGIIQKASSSLEGAGGTVVRVDEWGRRKLAYPIQKKGEGYYFVLEYTSSPAASKEVERLFKLNEDVLRYQTVRIIATKKAEEKTAAEAPAAATEAAPAEGGQANG